MRSPRLGVGGMFKHPPLPHGLKRRSKASPIVANLVTPPRLNQASELAPSRAWWMRHNPVRPVILPRIALDVPRVYVGQAEAGRRRSRRTGPRSTRHPPNRKHLAGNRLEDLRQPQLEGVAVQPKRLHAVEVDQRNREHVSWREVASEAERLGELAPTERHAAHVEHLDGLQPVGLQVAPADEAPG